MPRTAGSKDVAPMVRGAFKRANLILEGKGRSLSEMIAECMEENLLATLKVIAQFTPKEIEQTIDRKRGEEDWTDAELAAIIQGASSEDIATETESSGQLH